MKTYQDLLAVGKREDDRMAFIQQVIQQHGQNRDDFQRESGHASSSRENADSIVPRRLSRVKRGLSRA